jgi:acetyl esterase/lipase
MPTMPGSVHPHFRKRPVISWVAFLLLAGLVLPVLLTRLWVQPGAALVAYSFGIHPLVKVGPGYPEVRSAVRVTRNVPVAAPGARPARLDVYRPAKPASKALPVILWVHGGGFISGSKAQVASYATMLASSGYVVASLGYTLAPGAKFPTPVRQGNAALGYLWAHAADFGADPARFFVGGDSAGAQIASSLAAVQSNPALAQKLSLVPAVPAGDLRGSILFCGLYNMKTVADTHFPALRTFLWAYTGSRDWASFADLDELSTTSQVTAAYPATFLSVGDADPFQSQAFELEAVLHRAAVPVTTQYWNGTGDHLGHEYQFDFRIPQARQTYRETLAFLAARSAKESS